MVYGAMYQVPFWTAALVFPLHSGQLQEAAWSLTFQLLGIVLLVLGRRSSWLTLESVAYLGLWLAWYRLEGGPWWPLVLAGFLLTLRAPVRVRRACGNWTPQAALALGAAWWVLVFLPALWPLSVGSPVVYWIALWAWAVWLESQAREVAENWEVERGAPRIVDARIWRWRKEGGHAALGWLALAWLAQPGSSQGVASGLTLLAAVRLLRGRAVGRRFRCHPVGWLAAEMTLIAWGLQAPPLFGLGLVAFSAGLTTVLSLLVTQGDAPAERVEGDIGVDWEASLRDGLRHPAPPHLIGTVLGESASVELEETLVAAAPTGFRQRLLERLRQDDSDAEDLSGRD